MNEERRDECDGDGTGGNEGREDESKVESEEKL